MGTPGGYTGHQLTSGCAWPNICFSLMLHQRLGNLRLTPHRHLPVAWGGTVRLDGP